MKKTVFLLTLTIAACFLFTKPYCVRAELADIDADRLTPLKTDIGQLQKMAAKDAKPRQDKEIKYTPDDKVYHYFIIDYNAAGQQTKKSCYKMGKDGILFTPDDELQDYQVFEYASNGTLKKETSYDSAGKLQYEGYNQYDAKGKKMKQIRHNSKGEIIRVITYTCDAKGNLVQDVEYKGPGPDGKWGTSDDQIEKYHRFDYDAKGRMIRAREYHVDQQGKGPDGAWFTGDDVVSSTKEFFYNNDGTKSMEKKYISSGPDNVWFTGDDALQYYVKFEYGK